MILAVVTCPGREAHFRALCDQIAEQGWAGQVIAVRDPGGDGQKRTYFRALRECLGFGDHRFVIVEDDITLAPGALEAMRAAYVPGPFEFLTWFDGQICAPGAEPGIYPAWCQHFSCLQAVTWRASAARAVLDSPLAAEWTDPHNGDVLIARVLTGKRYGVRVPNLVQHVGAASVVTPGAPLEGLRVATNFPSEGR